MRGTHRKESGREALGSSVTNEKHVEGGGSWFSSAVPVNAKAHVLDVNTNGCLKVLKMKNDCGYVAAFSQTKHWSM